MTHSTEESRFGLPKQMRLKSSREFDLVFNGHVYAADDTLVINAIRRADECDRQSVTRLGLSIGKVVGAAPARNRWKRLIRESFRLSQHDLPRGLDIVVRPRRGAVPEFEAIKSSLNALCRKLERRLIK